jgi:hypothetical protein
MRSALQKAQDAAGGARERFDFVTQGEHDALASKVEHLEERLREVEARLPPT